MHCFTPQTCEYIYFSIFKFHLHGVTYTKPDIESEINVGRGQSKKKQQERKPIEKCHQKSNRKTTHKRLITPKKNVIKKYVA